MSQEIKVLALFGKSGSGKDTIQNLLLEHYPEIFRRVISCTTRPRRSNEAEGVDYHFVSEEEFAALAYENKFIEALEFNGWFYGSLAEDLDPDKINIGIFTPDGIDILFQTAEDYNLKILPVYVRCSDITRIFRALERENHPDMNEIKRRFQTDEADFSFIDYSYCTIYNEEEPIDSFKILQTMSDYCQDFFD